VRTTLVTVLKTLFAMRPYSPHRGLCGPLWADPYGRTPLVTAPEVIGARDGGNRPEQLPILLKPPTALSPKKRLVSTLYPLSFLTIDRINRIPLFVQLLRENKDTQICATR
jgi:hypothetical protein